MVVRLGQLVMMCHQVGPEGMEAGAGAGGNPFGGFGGFGGAQANQGFVSLTFCVISTDPLYLTVLQSFCHKEYIGKHYNKQGEPASKQADFHHTLRITELTRGYTMNE